MWDTKTTADLDLKDSLPYYFFYQSPTVKIIKYIYLSKNNIYSINFQTNLPQPRFNLLHIEYGIYSDGLFEFRTLTQVILILEIII